MVKMLSKEDTELRQKADREKKIVALSSVFAAVFLTVMKLVVGLMTASLGILSEAAHSGLDLVAATATLFGVSVSGRPADREHTYGHGKAENLSALFETMLLLVTCVWIIYEAVQRIFFKSVEVDASVSAFLIMGISIVVDFSRSRALSRTAKKYDSQALEADALHFTTDIWSSSVVIGGLVFVRLSSLLGLDWLMKTDALAALGVAGIVTSVSLRLGQRTIAGLLDAVPPRLRDEVTQALQIPGVLEVKRVRVRRSGPETFADVMLTVSRENTLEQAHNIATTAEAAVRKILPRADVTVHVEPTPTKDDVVLATIRNLARQIDGVRDIHNIRVLSLKDGLQIVLHAQVDPLMNLKDAHNVAEQLEQALREKIADAKHVFVHLEYYHKDLAKAEPLENFGMLQKIWKTVSSHREVKGLRKSRIYATEGRLHIYLDCLLDPEESVESVHRTLSHIEEELRDTFPDSVVEIHSEPYQQPKYTKQN